MVVSDYTSVAELIKHGVARDGSEAAQIALNAGTDMEMVSRFYNQNGAELVKSGKVSMKTVDGLTVWSSVITTRLPNLSNTALRVTEEKPRRLP